MKIKKRVGVGIAAATAAVVALVGGTMATFSDSEEGAGVGATAGTLDLVVGEGEAQSFAFENVVPGFHKEVQVTFTNGGSVDGLLDLGFSYTDSENGCTEPEAAVDGSCGAVNYGDLDDKMTLAILGPDGSNILGSTPYVRNYGSLPGYHQVDLTDLTLDAGESKTFTLVFDLPVTVDNVVQGDSFTLTLDGALEQASDEEGDTPSDIEDAA